ncbi:MAG: F0F1 ATP synthase subunit A [Dehalococcoidia bacterium]|nr:F0F1 ATP synthase subunit A [Dehalococcoidia bacterium]
MKLLLIAVAAIALMASGFLFVGGVSPAIVVAPEHIFTIGGLAITNTMFTSWWVVLLLLLVGFFTRRGLRLVPSGFAGFVEAAVEGFYGIVVSAAGEKNGRRFFPLVATIFFFVLTSNYFGLLPLNSIGKTEPGHGAKQVVFGQTSLPLIGDLAYIPLKPQTINVGAGEAPILPAGAEGHGAPAAPGKGAPGHGAALGASTDAVVSREPGAATASAAVEPKDAPSGAFSGALSPYFRSVNTDINAPLAIAIFSFLFVEFWGLQSLGPGYLKKFFAFDAIFKKGPLTGLIDIFVGILEFVSELSRMVSFTFRLFGNVFAGEVLLAMMSFLVPFLLVDVFYGLEMFVGLIQAFVFAMLTLVFAVTAVSHHGGEEHASAEGHVESEHHGAH